MTAINGIVVSKIPNICLFNKEREREIINMLNNNGPKIESRGTPLFHTNNYMKNLFLFVSDVTGSY